MKINEHNVEKVIAKDYIQKVIECSENMNQTRLGGFKREEVLMNFKDYFAKRMRLNENEIIQGENEINLSIDVYDIIKSKENWN
jgi:hypothetical protein